MANPMPSAAQRFVNPSTGILTTPWQQWLASVGNGANAPVTSVAGKTGAVALVVGDVSGAAPTASPTFTGTITAAIANFSGLVQFSGKQLSGLNVASGNAVMNDNEVTISGAGQDVGAIRGFCSTAATATLSEGRAVEAQATINSGATLSAGGTFAVEVGLHSQVAGNGNQTIGIFCASSHTGWLPNGVRNDVGVAVTGEDGWKVGYIYNDTDTTTLFQVDQNGALHTRQRVFVAPLPTSGTKYGILAPPQAPVGETWCGLWYDSANNVGRIEALTQGTANRAIAINPLGGGLLVGLLASLANAAMFQVAGAVDVGAGIALTAGGDDTQRISFGPNGATGIGIYAGSGAPTISAPKGSLYIRTDGSATNNRAYINTDGGTTWTAIVTVA